MNTNKKEKLAILSTCFDFLSSHKAYLGVFLLCFAYWTYLILTVQMVIAHDSIGYEANGALIYKEGFAEFFKNGASLSREPLYHLVIAFSMAIADLFSIHYHWVLKIIQVLHLFVAQLLLLVLLNMMKINKPIKLLTILYFGFSPAVINMTFSVYYEIISIPIVPAIVLAAVFSWKAVQGHSKGKIFTAALITTLIFIIASFGRSTFRYVFLGVLLPFVWTVITSYCADNKSRAKNYAIYILTALLVFFPFMEAYKYTNKHYNGFYQFNNRHPELFMASVIKRSKELTPRIVLAHLANIPGEGVCRKFFTEKECEYCGWMGSYSYDSDVQNLVAYTTKENRNRTILLVSFDKIKEHPFQYMFYMGYEAARMFFWESASLGYVQYPQIIDKIYKAGWFRYGIRLIIAVLTIFSVIFLLWNTIQRRFQFSDYTENGETARACLFITLVVASYIGIYSLVYVLTRYALPIGSLYLLSIAYCMQTVRQSISLTGSNRKNVKLS